MKAKRNSYFFSRLAVSLKTGAMPSVTIACSTFHVDELAYRTSPTRYELIARHVSRVDDTQTFNLDLPLLNRIRCSMTRLSAAVRRDADRYLEQHNSGSCWFFQPRQDGWLAMFDGKPKDVHAFNRWLFEILA